MLDQGQIPFFSWHHLEELLCIGNDTNARARIAFIQSLPLIAWMRMPDEENGIGAIIDIIAAEAMALDQGCSSAAEVCTTVRGQLLHTGSGEDAIGPDAWVWESARAFFLQRRAHLGMVAALSGFRVLDERQTFGELANQPPRSREDRTRVLAAIHANALREVKASDRNRSEDEARAMADAFVARAVAMLPPEDMSSRDLMTRTYLGQGIDPDEIRDDCRISDLSALGTFRSQLAIVAEKTGLTFDRLKRLRMELFPSWLISDAVRQHGQKRKERPGSDVHDHHLLVNAAYVDRVYVDKRTLEDFRQVRSKAPAVAALMGEVTRASHYGKLVVG